VSNCSTLPRVQAALRAFATSWVDIALASTVQSCDNAQGLAALHERTLLRGHVPAPDWAAHRRVLEVDGNANAWGAIWAAADPDPDPKRRGATYDAQETVEFSRLFCGGRFARLF
jgi:hypothetical protein